MLCIAMMCTTPFEVQGQNRRTGGNSNTSTSKTKSTESTLKARPEQSRPSQTTAAPQRKETPKAAPQRNSQTTQRSNHATQQHKSAPAPQVQDRRNTTNAKPSGSSSHSAQISRKNSDIGRQNIPSNREVKPANKSNNKPAVKPNNSGSKAPKPQRHNDPIYGNRPANHKPAAVQYHNEPPRPREPHYTRPYLEPRHAPVPSHRYGDHYFGYRLNTLPRGYVTMRVGGLDYYYYDGIYYRPYRLGGYYVVRPPRGTSIASTLFNVALTAIAINTIRNEVERAQRAAALAQVYSTANTGYVIRNTDDYVTNVANQLNQEYYYQDGVFYILQNGQYYVIEAPIGALVTQIPNDYEEIELDGRTYYIVENTLYKTTVIDGALYFEVVSNL
jgi:hypothetical protein